MTAESGLTVDERRTLVDRRLDELDRALLGLLPRSERLALVASVETRVLALGADVSLAREVPVEAPVSAMGSTEARSRGRRSRLAFSSGVLGIVAVSCLVASPLLLVALSIFGELLGETFSILLFGVLTALVTLGGGLAVVCGGASLLRLARRGQSATGTGWAITGLCTGALPMLVGIVGLLSLGAQIVPASYVRVTMNTDPTDRPATENGPVFYQPGPPAVYPAMIPESMPSPFFDDAPQHPSSSNLQLLPPAPLTGKEQPVPKTEAATQPESEPDRESLPAAPPDDSVEPVET